MARYKNRAMYEFIPGMEAVMEDTDVDVDVEVEVEDDGAEEVVADVEAEEATEDATEAEVDSAETETAVGMTLRRYSEIENALAHVRRYGVDRSFVSLMNYNNTLGRVINVSFPSVESMDATGDPYSRLSQQTIAGLENVLHTVWAWIKQLCQRIVGAFKKAGTWIMDLIRGFERKIQKLEKDKDDKQVDPEKINDLSPSDKIVEKSAAQRINDEAAKAAKDGRQGVKTYEDHIDAFLKKKDAFDNVDIDNGFGASEKELRTADKDSDKLNTELSKRKNAWQQIQNRMRPDKSIKSMSADQITSLVNDSVTAARTWWDKIKDLRSDLDSAQRTVNSIENQVNRLEGDKRTERKVRGVKHLGKMLSMYQRIVHFIIETHIDLVKFHIKQAATLISKCYSEKDSDASPSSSKS